MPTVFECEACHQTFLYPAKLLTPVNGNGATFETHNCPYCKSPDLKEHVEPAQGKISALLEVPNSEVNARLAEGYEIMEDKIYAKATIMVKREAEAQAVTSKTEECLEVNKE